MAKRRTPEGRAFDEVRVNCRRCRDRFPGRSPGLLGAVYVPEDSGPVAVVSTGRNRTRGELPTARGRVVFTRVHGFAQLECPACGHRPRSHRDRLENDARAELARHGDRLYL